MIIIIKYSEALKTFNATRIVTKRTELKMDLLNRKEIKDQNVFFK